MIFAHLVQIASSLPTDASALESSISALESAISALESDIKTLDVLSVPWERSVWVFTFLVAVGVAMELWVIRHEYRDDMEAWALAYFGVLRSPGRPSIKKLCVEGSSVLLITIGIIEELGIGIKIASINGELRGKSAVLRSKNAELRSKSDQLLALVTQEAGDANLKAGEANERAAANELQAQQLKAENLGLEAIIAPRNLSLDQQKRIADACRTFRNHGVAIRSYGMDGESAALGAQIIAALRSAHIIVVDDRGSITVSGGFDTGIHVRSPDAEKEFASVLGKALSVIGKLKVSVNDPEPRMGAVMGGGGEAFTPGSVFLTLTVGVKPLPIIPPAE